VPVTGKRKHPSGDMQEIDTRNILFICGGAFVGLDKIIQQRIKSKGIGFQAAVQDQNAIDKIYQQTTNKDIIQYGLIPEFIGRFGLVINVDELSVEDLVQVLKEPRNSFVRQYEYIFELDGIELAFEDAALTTIAKHAKELKTNARGLKNIIEKCLLPYQFDAVNLVERGLKKIIISKDTVEGKPATLIFENGKENGLSK
jgi:ATP-dependent Clp protease ATP-binding subunit ClpX